MSELHDIVKSLLEDEGCNPNEDLKELLQLLAEPDTKASTSSTTTPFKAASPTANTATTTTTTTTTSLRTILGKHVETFKELLSDLMANRVSIDELLPMTYDDDANEEAMGDQHALTLTESSMLAARVYARLLSSPGAFSAGMVELHVLSELPRLLARWRTECTGRESGLLASSTKDTQPTKRARMSDDNDSDSDSEGSYDNDGVVMEEVGDGNSLTTRQLILRGLEVALEISQVPLQAQFTSWNKDCRGAIINAIGSSLATTAALFKYNQRQDKGVDVELAQLAAKVIEAASLALRNCLVANPDISQLTAIESVVDVQRNLYSLIALKEADLPNGEDGQAAAAHVASEVFQKLVIAATAFATESDARTHYAGPDGTPIGKSGGKRRSILATPAPSSTPAQMPSTARRSELRRSSVGSPTPLKLKGRRMSDISNRSSPRNTTSQSGSLHPVLERVASMMQKLLTEPRNSASKVRTFTCAAVEKCLLKSTNKELIHFVLDWVIKISRSNADFHRLAAIRLCSFAVANESSLLVESAMRLDAEDGDETVVHSIVAAKLFDALRGRLLDMKQAVRVAAAKELITLFDVASDDDNRTLLRLLQVHAEDLVEVFRSLALEDSTITGKATFIKGLVSMLGLGEQLMLPITEADVGVLVVACQDSKSDTIRAVAADGLTSLLELATEDVMVSSLTNHWSQTVLPLVLDSQPKVQAKALQLVDQILLSPLVSEQDIQKRPSCRAWNCLSVISNRSVQPGSSKVEFEALRAAVAQRSDVADILVHCQYVGNLALEVDAEDVVTSGHEAGLWCLLCAILEHKDDISEISLLIKRNRKVKSGFDFAFRSFHELFDPSNLLRSPSIHQSARVYCLEVLGRLSFCLDLPFAGVRDHLVNLLSTFQLDAAYIAAAVRLFVASTICSSSHGDARTQSLSAIRGMLERCQHEILANAESASVDTRDTTSLSRALCSVGELCMAGFRVDDTCGKKDTATMISSLELDVRPSDKLSEAIFAISDSAIFAESIRGSALVVLGKMCLRDESLAHQCLSIFVRALSSEEGPIIRSNALLCMGDMIVRYTNLADRFVPEMATCLQAGISTGKGSTHVIVRKHAVLVLADLILQDYIKWRGLLFHRFLVACVDEDDEVALLAESMLCGPLKKGRLFASHFVESLFVFNGCDAHDMLKDRQGGVGTGADVSFGGIDFKGQQGQALRGKLYAIILSQLVDEDMIAATIGIAKDVVERCLQQGSELHRACVTSDKNDPAYNVLLDALTVLSSNAVRPRAAEASGDLDNTLKSEAAQLKVRGALLLKMSRKHLMESMLPLLVQLNEVLRINHSPLVQEVLNYFVVLLRLFPDEMGDNLSVKHPRLLSEVRFEAK